MTLKELYEQIGGNYETAKLIMNGDESIGRSLSRLLNDGSFDALKRAAEAHDAEAVFIAATAVKNSCAGLGLISLSRVASEVADGFSPDTACSLSDAEAAEKIAVMDVLYKKMIEDITRYKEKQKPVRSTAEAPESSEVKKIFFDMDGVLADFDNGVVELCSLPRPRQGHDSAEQNEAMWDAIRDAGHFYRRLKPMPGAIELFNAVYEKYGDRCEILTGVPKPKRNIPEAGQDKIDWAREYLNDTVVVNIVLREDKINYCFGPEYILIDDYTKNGLEWKRKGGTVINHSSSEETLEQLKAMNIL